MALVGLRGSEALVGSVQSVEDTHHAEVLCEPEVGSEDGLNGFLLNSINKRSDQ